MERPDFLKFIGKLVHYYERKTLPTAKTIDLWFEDLKDVDAEAIPAIFDSIKQGERFPSNLPAAVISAWRDWLRIGNGKNRNDKGRYACNDCGGTGLLFVRRVDRDLGCKTDYVFRCKRCGQADINAPFANLSDLMVMGYEINEPCTQRQAPIPDRYKRRRGSPDSLGFIAGNAINRFAPVQ
jgi:hypothetical protein